MKNLSKYLWILFFLVALYFIIPDKYTMFIRKVFDWSSSTEHIDSDDSQSLQDSIAEMKKRILLYEEMQLQADQKISSYEDSLIELSQKIANNNLKIQELKKVNYEKANSVTKYNTDELYKFLSDRYKDSIK